MVEKEIVKKHYKDHQYKQRLFFVSCVLIDGKMYSVTNLGKIPIRVDIEKQEITCIDRWDKENAINPAIMIADDDDIYLFETGSYYVAWWGSHYIDEAGFRDLPAFASRVLGLKGV